MLPKLVKYEAFFWFHTRDGRVIVREVPLSEVSYLVVMKNAVLIAESYCETFDWILYDMEVVESE